MDTTTALLIAIPVLVVLAGVLLFAAARRRDTGEAIGLLTRETRKRDRGSVRPDPEFGRRNRTSSAVSRPISPEPKGCRFNSRRNWKIRRRIPRVEERWNSIGNCSTCRPD